MICHTLNKNYKIYSSKMIGFKILKILFYRNEFKVKINEKEFALDKSSISIKKYQKTVYGNLFDFLVKINLSFKNVKYNFFYQLKKLFRQ